MKQNLLKEMEAGSKNALLKKGSSHIIYIMEAPLLPIWPRNSILVCPQPPNSSMKCVRTTILTTTGNWRLVAAAIQVYTDSTRNQDTSLG